MLFSDIAILFFSDIAILFFSDFTILIVDFSTPPMGHALRYGVCSLPPTPNNPRCSELLPDAGRKTICFPGELFTQQHSVPVCSEAKELVETGKVQLVEVGFQL
ncbi:hypothetical protein LINPERHAP1_LOCUS22388 [Linum perenne]